MGTEIIHLRLMKLDVPRVQTPYLKNLYFYRFFTHKTAKSAVAEGHYGGV